MTSCVKYKNTMMYFYHFDQYKSEFKNWSSVKYFYSRPQLKRTLHQQSPIDPRIISRPMSDTYPLSALHLACLRDDAETVRRMLASGASFDSVSVHGSMPLHAASRSGTAVMELLLERRANVHCTDNNGLTALHTAAFDNNSEALQMLLAEGADMSARSTHLGSTALHVACKCGRSDAALTLLQQGADCLSIGHRGNSPLHYATAKGSKAIITLLVEYGADVFVVNSDGDTAENIAVKNGFPEATAVLQRFSAQARQETRDRREAFVMGIEERLGAQSWVSCLQEDLVYTILGRIDAVNPNAWSTLRPLIADAIA